LAKFLVLGLLYSSGAAAFPFNPLFLKLLLGNPAPATRVTSLMQTQNHRPFKAVTPDPDEGWHIAYVYRDPERNSEPMDSYSAYMSQLITMGQKEIVDEYEQIKTGQKHTEWGQLFVEVSDQLCRYRFEPIDKGVPLPSDFAITLRQAALLLHQGRPRWIDKVRAWLYRRGL
jgi:hypothetical protein